MEEILKEFEKYKGQLVITDGLGNVQRLIAVGDDNEDYYWVFWDGRKTIWQSCCGGFIPLKGYISDKNYNGLKNLAKINHYDSPECWMPRDKEAKENILKINKEAKQEVETLSKGHKYLTEICWDIV